MSIIIRHIQESSERTEVTINYNGNEKKFKMKPLTDGELTKLKRIEYNSFKFKLTIDEEGNKKRQKQSEQETEVDTGEFTENQKNAMYTAIAWSLSTPEEEVPVSAVENMPKGNYIVIPQVSSQRRPYIPMGYMDDSVLCSDKVRILPDVSLYLFGVLESSVHMGWMRTISCRLKSDYSYTVYDIYNCFPWPSSTEEQKSKI